MSDMEMELEVCEFIDTSYQGKVGVSANPPTFTAELRLIPVKGGSCIRFTSERTKDRAQAEQARDLLLKFLKGV